MNKKDQEHYQNLDKFDPKNQTFIGLHKMEENQKLMKKPSILQRKINRIFGGTQQLTKNFILGFQYGLVIGGIMGFFPGIYMVIRTRKVSILFLSTISGAVSFGFFAGVGFIVRNNMISIQEAKNLGNI